MMKGRDIVLRILGEVDGHVQGFSSVVTAFPGTDAVHDGAVPYGAGSGLGSLF